MKTPNKTTVQFTFKSKLGPIFLVASNQGLEGVFLEKQAAIPLVRTLDPSSPAEKIISQTAQQLEEYFQGKRKKFSIPLSADGTPFQKQVWKALQDIPYGKTCSYRDIAQKIKNKKAFRAVGTANGKNPHCIIVPCHRVIAADGTLGGYSGGLQLKSRLLQIEGITTRK